MGLVSRTSRPSVIACSFALALSGTSCSKKELQCGPGTHEVNGVCIAGTASATPSDTSSSVSTAKPEPKNATAATPDEASLLAAFGDELTSNGVNFLRDQINSEKKGDKPSAWTQKDAKTYTLDEMAPGMFANSPKIHIEMTIAVTGVKLEKGDTDDYPFEGAISWRCTGNPVSRCGSARSGSTKYLFSKRSEKWKQKDAVARR